MASLGLLLLQIRFLCFVLWLFYCFRSVYLLGCSISYDLLHIIPGARVKFKAIIVVLCYVIFKLLLLLMIIDLILWYDVVISDEFSHPGVTSLLDIQNQKLRNDTDAFCVHYQIFCRICRARIC